jgi:hypothetical protein
MMQVAGLQGRPDYGEEIGLADLYRWLRDAAASQYTLGDRTDFPSQLLAAD